MHTPLMEAKMAVQKSRKTPSKIGMRRSHQKNIKPSYQLIPQPGKLILDTGKQLMGFTGGKKL